MEAIRAVEHRFILLGVGTGPVELACNVGNASTVV